MKIVVTGGTFLKEYCPRSGDLCFNDRSKLLDSFLESINLSEPIAEVLVFSMIDSRQFTDDDRRRLYSFCFEAANEHQLLIIHGTDTMEYTAKYFAQQKSLCNTVIFTGAWTPLVCKNTDAEFNMGFAIACAKIMPHGVYIAMNGECFQANNCRKNWNKMVFENTLQTNNV